MKVRIEVGDVVIRLDDVDLTHRQVRGLIKYAVGAAAAMAVVNPSDSDETADSKQALGFAATIERLPETIPQENFDWLEEE